nr:MAG: hypothetical protein [Microvirus sp.]
MCYREYCTGLRSKGVSPPFTTIYIYGMLKIPGSGGVGLINFLNYPIRDFSHCRYITRHQAGVLSTPAFFYLKEFTHVLLC